MNRAAALAQLRSLKEPWDFIIIGGGATGMGIAVDAASRGYTACLLEQSDFGKGTSSRSTKLIHGGVRYLRQGNVSLVMEALRERGILRRNAPHLVRDLPFIVPNYACWEAPFYGVGLKVYDMLAGEYGFGKSRHLSTEEVLSHIPTLDRDGLRGGTLYYDGQFDDARLLIDLALTATEHGAALLNYAPVISLLQEQAGTIQGVQFQDLESGEEHELRARSVINATGAFCDTVRRMETPDAPPMIAPSQGIHLVLDKKFLPGDAAIMVPRTKDGRVLFVIPWHGHALLGTTDTPISQVALEPQPLDGEIEFILQTAGQYLAMPPTRRDVLSVFAGIRPLVRSSSAERTAVLSRDHTIQISKGGLVTIAGGKWTTYRRMAEDCIDHAASAAGLEMRPCRTHQLPIHSACETSKVSDALWYYGSTAEKVRALIASSKEMAQQLHPALPLFAAQVIWSVRHEMARTLDDVLSRRTRALLLNARAAIEMSPKVAQLMATELGRNPVWEGEQIATFTAMARAYLCPP